MSLPRVSGANSAKRDSTWRLRAHELWRRIRRHGETTDQMGFFFLLFFRRKASISLDIHRPVIVTFELISAAPIASRWEEGSTWRKFGKGS